MRVIICGSRDWSDHRAIQDILSGYRQFDQEVTIVHGGCPSGADAIADAIARGFGLTVEVHPADWGTHGKVAGPRRNLEMAKLGADMCWAFKNGFNWNLSKGGTENMVLCASKCGIPTFVVSRA